MVAWIKIAKMYLVSIMMTFKTTMRHGLPNSHDIWATDELKRTKGDKGLWILVYIDKISIQIPNISHKTKT